MAIENIDISKCIGCGKCRDICPVDVIRIDKQLNKAFIKYGQDCMLCQLCLIVCPTNAITLTKEKHDKIITSWG